MKVIRQRTRKLAWALTLAVAAWLLPTSMALAGHGHGGGHMGGGGGGFSPHHGYGYRPHHGGYGGAIYYPWGYDAYYGGYYYGGYNGSAVAPNFNNGFYVPWGLPPAHSVLDDLMNMGIPF